MSAAGARLIDPSNWFCTATTCPPVIDGIVVYSDNTHHDRDLHDVALPGARRRPEETHRVKAGEQAPGIREAAKLSGGVSCLAVGAAGAYGELGRQSDAKAEGVTHCSGRDKLKPSTGTRPDHLEDRPADGTGGEHSPRWRLFRPRLRRGVSSAFTVHCGDKAQAGSIYARSELREMNRDGSTRPGRPAPARTGWSWATRHAPARGQAKARLRADPQHDRLSDPVVLDGEELYVSYKDDVVGVLDDDYQLGTYFDLPSRPSTATWTSLQRGTQGPPGHGRARVLLQGRLLPAVQHRHGRPADGLRTGGDHQPGRLPQLSG